MDDTADDGCTLNLSFSFSLSLSACVLCSVNTKQIVLRIVNTVRKCCAIRRSPMP